MRVVLHLANNVTKLTTSTKHVGCEPRTSCWKPTQAWKGCRRRRSLFSCRAAIKPYVTMKVECLDSQLMRAQHRLHHPLYSHNTTTLKRTIT